MRFFEKGNNLEELINIPTKAEERSLVQVSFMTHDQTSRKDQSGIRVKFPADPRSTAFSKSANPLDLRQKSTICAFFKAKSVNPKTYSPPS